ncbi:MAG: bi-domain-containing oxidoreductase [Fimbriimonadaceae bacterium]|nr:bi-domain-containing oxidoreductase [Chitinophagales bacterium]
MKQVILNLKTGATILEEIPDPVVKPGYILIKTHRSLISVGTERMLVEFSRYNLINKARQQPEKVKQVLDKIKSDGLFPTIETIFRRLDEPMPLGYCNAGEVIAVGKNVDGIKIGDRVASNGHHAEIVCVPKNLVAKIPEHVNYDAASCAIIGAVALHGIRLTQPQLGETVVVIGLGLVGLITCDLLRSNGCNVIGIDVNNKRLEYAENKNIISLNSNDSNNCFTYINAATNNFGADAVIITASTKSDDVISLAAKCCRKKGKVVLVGVVGLQLNRDDFYKKEISFQVSASYGPGRYDDEYEEKGLDYPYPYVRWTAKRNFEAILQAIEEKRIDVTSLITNTIDLSEVDKVYNDLRNDDVLATIIKYPDNTDRKNIIHFDTKQFSKSAGIIGIIGAGNFTKMTLLPLLTDLHAQIKYIANTDGLDAAVLAKKYRIQNATSDYKNILNDPDVDSVIITTRHETHAQICIDAIHAGKNIFVEKPLCIREDELIQIADTIKENNYTKILAVGFNRRYAPAVQKVKQLIKDSSKTNLIITVNAGLLPNDSWLHDVQTGGGRIIGEACHFIDLAACICNSDIVQVYASYLGNDFSKDTDNVIINLKMKNGAQATVQYFSNGNKSYSKERIEIFNTEKTLIIDNFRKMQGFGFNNFSSSASKQDKGHYNQWKQFIDSVQTGNNSMPALNTIFNSMNATFAVINSMQLNQPVLI